MANYFSNNPYSLSQMVDNGYKPVPDTIGISSFLGGNPEWESGLHTDLGQTNPLGATNLDLKNHSGLSNLKEGFGLGQVTLGGLGSLMEMYTGLKALGLAKKDYALKRQSQETNLDNQVQSYNTAIADRIHSRASQNANISPDQQQDYINRNSVSKAAL